MKGERGGIVGAGRDDKTRRSAIGGGTPRDASVV